MGTNYYVVKNRPSVQPPIHIGKASYGWLFHFESQNNYWNEPPIIWNTYGQVKEWLKKYTVESTDYVIMDEYDDIVPYEDFVRMVDERQEDEFNKANPDLFKNCKNVDGYRFSDEEFL